METGPSTGTTGHPASPPLDRTGDKAGQRGQPSCDATGGAALGARLLADHLGLHRHKAHKADGGQLSPRNNFELRRTFPIRRFCARQHGPAVFARGRSRRRSRRASRCRGSRPAAVAANDAVATSVTIHGTRGVGEWGSVLFSVRFFRSKLDVQRSTFDVRGRRRGLPRHVGHRQPG